MSSYGEDIAFWSEARAATRGDFDAWARHWVLEPATHDAYLGPPGTRPAWPGCQAAHRSRRRGARTPRPIPWTPTRRSSGVGARRAPTAPVRCEARRCAARTPTPCWPAPGVANLAAWVAVARARAGGQRVTLTAELGLWGYTPTPADPYIFNHRVFPGTPLLADASTVLGMVVGGAGHAHHRLSRRGPGRPGREPQLDPRSPAGRSWWGRGEPTTWPAGPTACVVVSLARPERLVERVGYVTSPGARVTQRGHRPRACCAASTACCASRRCRAAPSPVAERVRALVGACGWDVDRWRPTVEELDPVTTDEVLALRRYDPERLFLS